MNYAVIFRYSFDDAVIVHVFATEEEAKRFLRDSYKSELFCDQECGYSTESELREDGWYAKITNHFCDHENITEMLIGSIYG
ncbi:hypothetical protein [Agathobaculum desmolans]|uniref:hypothetical protein n=1 Tax=Agathobaculum desmolans TaxID=39484 RepID=UPI00248DF455|nr:hypothetical protein [Agathobaculum desmolans]